MSKFSLDVLNKIVFSHCKTTDPDVILGATFGEDVALTRVGKNILVSHLDPIVGAVKKIGWLAVHVACNDIATSGAPPRWIQLLVLVPDQDDEALLEQIMQDVDQAAGEIGAAVIGGHTGYSAGLSRPLVAVTALGTLTDQAPVLTKGAKPGDHIFVSKGIALEGTAILASDFSGAARDLGLMQMELEEAAALMRKISVIPEALLLAKQGATAMHDVTRGGILETLLEIALLSGVGMRVAEDRIPIPAIVERFVEAFDFDPLKMISSGTLVATISPGKVDAAMAALIEAGIPFADVGEVVMGEGVTILRDDGERRYEDIQPEADELARMWTQYPVDPQ